MKYSESPSRRKDTKKELDESRNSVNKLQTFIDRKGLSVYSPIVPFAVRIHD